MDRKQIGWQKYEIILYSQRFKLYYEVRMEIDYGDMMYRIDVCKYDIFCGLFRILHWIVTCIMWGIDGIWWSIEVAEVMAVVFSALFLVLKRKKYGYWFQVMHRTWKLPAGKLQIYFPSARHIWADRLPGVSQKPFKQRPSDSKAGNILQQKRVVGPLFIMYLSRRKRRHKVYRFVFWKTSLAIKRSLW